MISRYLIHLLFTVGVAAATMSCGNALGSDPDPVGAVNITPPSARVEIGSTLELEASVEDAQGDRLLDRRVYWTAEDSDIASVSASGVVTAHAPGTTQITATSEGVSDIATVVVTSPRVDRVVVLPNEVEVRIGSTIALRAVAYDAAGTELPGLSALWSSSTPAVAPVDADGRVSALSEGEALITALIGGQSGFARVRVTDRPDNGDDDDDHGGGGRGGDGDDDGGEGDDDDKDDKDDKGDKDDRDDKHDDDD